MVGMADEGPEPLPAGDLRGGARVAGVRRMNAR